MNNAPLLFLCLMETG